MRPALSSKYRILRVVSMRSNTVMVFLKSWGQDDQIQERLLLNLADSKLLKMPGPALACFFGVKSPAFGSVGFSARTTGVFFFLRGALLITSNGSC